MAFGGTISAMTTFKAWLDTGVTPGEAIIILLTVVSLIPSIYFGFRNTKFRFSMGFLLPHTDEQYESSRKTLKGVQKIITRIRTRAPVDLALIDIRFVQTHFFRRPSNAPTEKIEILEVLKIEWGDQFNPSHQITPNGVGGFRIHLRKKWAQGDYLYLHLLIDAKSHWMGHLSFQGTAERRGYVRKPFEVLRGPFGFTL